MKRIVTLAALWVTALSAPAEAQTVPRAEVTAGIARGAWSYRFENDSSFDTAFLVPHFFEQHYERTGADLEARLHYRVRRRILRTGFSYRPETTAFGSDFDTFFQPGGDVAISGTAGDVRLTGFGIEQAIEMGSAGGGTLSAVFAWRRDRANFLPADRVVTHTQPPSETREWITDREVTVSQTFEVGVEGEWRRQSAGSRWRVETTARVMPALRARLLVQLPDKYPGRDIVFSAAGWSADGRVALSRQFGGMDGGLWLSAGRAGSYRSSARFSRDAIAGGVLIAFGSRP